MVADYIFLSVFCQIVFEIINNSLIIHDNNIMETTKKSNKLIKSKKYQGIYHKDASNDRMYYIAYKNSNGNYSRYKVGLKSSCITELYCYNPHHSIGFT